MSPLRFTSDRSSAGNSRNRGQIDLIIRELQRSAPGITVSVTHAIQGTSATIRASLIPILTKGTAASQPPNYQLGTITVATDREVNIAVLAPFKEAIREYIIERR